jgi:hypothetical protein
MANPDPFLGTALQALAWTINTLFRQSSAHDDALDPITRAHCALVDISNRLGVTLPQEALAGRVSAAQAWGELSGWIDAGLRPLTARPGSDLGEPANRLRTAMREIVAIEQPAGQIARAA